MSIGEIGTEIVVGDEEDMRILGVIHWGFEEFDKELVAWVGVKFIENSWLSFDWACFSEGYIWGFW